MLAALPDELQDFGWGWGGIWGRNLRRVRLTSSRQESESSRVLSKQRHRSDAAVALFSRPWRKLFGCSVTSTSGCFF